jgi:hypothetical protein
VAADVPAAAVEAKIGPADVENPLVAKKKNPVVPAPCGVATTTIIEKRLRVYNF